jgi:hypothetical protein
MNIGPASVSVPPGSSLDVRIELDAGFAAIGRGGEGQPALDGGVVAQVVGGGVRGVFCVGGGLHLGETRRIGRRRLWICCWWWCQVMEGERGPDKISGVWFAKLFRQRTTRQATIYGRVGGLVVEWEGRGERDARCWPRLQGH